MPNIEKLRAALADFRAAQAALNRVIREAPAGDAGRLLYENALRAAVAAGERLEKARALQ